MTHRIPLLIVFALLAVAFVPQAPAPLEFRAALSGTATNATGSATFTITRGSATDYDPDAAGPTTVTYSATVTGLSGAATQAHIHGPAGTTAGAGPIVTLSVSSQNTSGTVLAGSFTSTGHATITMDSLLVLMQNGNSYVNIHTAANPSGEIRGQIVDRD